MVILSYVTSIENLKYRKTVKSEPDDLYCYKTGYIVTLE